MATISAHWIATLSSTPVTYRRFILFKVLAKVLLMGSPILMISSYEYVEYVDGQMVTACLSPVDTLWPASFFVGSIVLFFIVPLAILLVLYSVIAKNLMDNPSIIMSNGNRGNVYKYRKQVIFMLGAVVVSFFVCLLPFRAFTLWIIIVPSEAIVSIGIERFYILLYFCRIMLYMNSAINPILYNLMSSKFRNGFLQLLGCGKIVRSDSISSGVRKGGGTFHTGSTNLSSSHGTHGSIQRKSLREDVSQAGGLNGGSLHHSIVRRPTVQFQQAPVMCGPPQQPAHQHGRRHSSIISIRATNQPMDPADSLPPSTSELRNTGEGGGREEHLKIAEETEEGINGTSNPVQQEQQQQQQQPSLTLPNSNGFHRIKDKVRFNGHQSRRRGAASSHQRHHHSGPSNGSHVESSTPHPQGVLNEDDTSASGLQHYPQHSNNNDNKRFSLLQATAFAATTTVVMIVASNGEDDDDDEADEGDEDDEGEYDAGTANGALVTGDSNEKSDLVVSVTTGTVAVDGCNLIDGTMECDI
uniref:Thyrotropin-releasing hormone receptor n=1 Tax=Anopheles albimanus TaxID=7167 RepID=A0A182FAY0_ANOAL